MGGGSKGGSEFLKSESSRALDLPPSPTPGPLSALRVVYERAEVALSIIFAFLHLILTDLKWPYLGLETRRNSSKFTNN